MMLNKYLVLTFCSLFLICHCSCDNNADDDQIPKPMVCETEYDGQLELIWSSLIREDSSQETSIVPQIFANDILINNNYPGDLNTIYSFDPETGEKQWTWDKFPGIGGRITPINPSQRFDNFLYFHYYGYKVLFDVDKQESVWVYDALHSLITSVGIGDYLYYSQRDKDKTMSELKRVLKTQTPGWDVVHREDNGNLMSTPALWMNPNGDSILVAGLVKFWPREFGVLAYNLSKDEVEWKLEKHRFG